ncbi:MAG: S8 family peptidase [Candidatus Nanopelagicales bacterium]
MPRYRRSLIAAAALAVLAGTLAAVPSAGAADETPVPASLRALARIPAVLQGSSGPVSVMLELDAPPASTAYAASAGTTTRDRRVATQVAISRVESLQASVRARLSAPATKSTVLFETSKVYAGIAVRTDASRLAALAAIPGVKSIQRLVPKQRDNFVSVPLVKAPEAWVDAGKTGKGVTVGIIDTGIDYTHADFGGPGTVAAYQAALAAKDAGQSPAYPDTEKVAGGYDFVGNAYNASDPDKMTPIPDDNPLDCGGHGTHVAGTTAGYGVAADGTTYRGPWTASTPFDTMGIGPGVAPEATLYALKIFGCEGSTNVVVEALDWAADPNGDGDLSDHLDVVNMSLGSEFGSPQDPDSVASNNAVDVGIAVIASAGNSGDIYEITGSPGIATKALNVAASEDRGQIVDGFSASIAGSSANYPALLSEAYDWTGQPGVTNAAVVQLGDWSQSPSADNNTDGCSPFSDADAAKAAGKVVLLQWNDNNAARRCGSAGRSGNAATAGAAGAILGSSATLLTVGILGVDSIPVVLSDGTGTTAIHEALGAGKAVTATLTNALRNSVRNIVPVGPTDPTDTVMDFSSRGTALAGNVKPDVSAPGGTIFSAAVGTGNQGVSYSGTSMAAPMTAGVAALMVEAHPTWNASEIKAGLMNTADHDLYLDAGRTGPTYDVLRAGAGRIDAVNAVRNETIAYVVDDPGAVSVSFGVMNVTRPTTVTKTVRIADKRASGSAATYAVSIANVNSLPGATYSVSPSSVKLSPGATKDVTVTLAIDPSRLIHKADPTITLDPLEMGVMRDFLTDASALLTVSTPGGTSLRVPVFSAPRPASAISAAPVTVKGSGALKKGTLTLRGQQVNVRGTESYERELSRVSALQLVAESPALPECEPGISTGCWTTEDERSADIRYLGVTSDARVVAAAGKDPLSAEDGAYAYVGVSSWAPWRTASDIASFLVYLDTNNDGNPEAILANSRLGESDLLMSMVISVRASDPLAVIDIESLNNMAGNRDTAKMHSNAMVLPVSLGALAHPTDSEGNALEPFIAPGQTTISYWVEAYGGSTLIDTIGHPRVPLRVDLTAPPLTAFDADGNMPTRAMAGKTLTVTLDPARAGDNPRLLLLHHLNVLARKAQVVPVSVG